jgi:hypothetical protein
MQRKFGSCLIALMICLGPVIAQAKSEPAAGQLSDLSITIGITSGSIDWFNRNARPTDIAAFFGPSVSLIDQVTAGQKIVLYPSAATAEQDVPALAGKINMIGYDIEHWPQTPQNEQVDPVSAIKRMRALADKYGLKLGVGPDRAYALQYGAQFAPYVDQFTLQLQKLQANNTALQSFATPLIDQIHQANSKVRIIVQLRTDAGVDGLIQTADSIKNQIDVVGVLYTPQTLGVVEDFVTKLRSGQPAPAPTSTPGATVQPPAGPTSTPIPAATLQPAATATTQPANVTPVSATPTAGTGVATITPTRAPVFIATATPIPLPPVETTSGVELLLMIIIFVLILIIIIMAFYLALRRNPRAGK